MAAAPAKADFALVIDFDKNQPRPQRIFQAADRLIAAFEAADRTLVTAIDIHIEPLLMLEDIEAGSLKIWLRNILEAADEQALKELNWKPQVGKYLVKAKFILIDFLNKHIEAHDRKRLAQLRTDLMRLAAETNVRHLPDYAPVPIPELLSCLEKMADAKSRLARTDSIRYVANDEEVMFDMDIEWSPETIENLYVKEVISHPASAMIFLIKKPDYIGNSQWEFRHGRRPIFAKIADEKWLRKFQSRSIDVRPGDALRCQVMQEVRYGYDNEVISERHVVVKVEKVLENRAQQLDMLDDEDNA